jgi:hypothetical protein
VRRSGTTKAPARNGHNGKAAVQADYILGDPAEPGPITGGTLALEAACLRFRGNGSAELTIDLEQIQGMTVSGARTAGATRGARGPRGTTRVAAFRGDTPLVWEFAIDRSKAVMLRERVNRALAGIGRAPLPFVEALYEFELPTPEPRIHTGNRSNGNGGATRSRPRSNGATANGVATNGAAANGTTANGARVPDARSNGLAENTAARAESARIQALKNFKPSTKRSKPSGQPSRQRSIVFAIVAGIVALEIIITLLVLFVF